MLYPLRDQQLKKLQEGHFDVLVIGGGATGAGVALDAAARGLKTALIEAQDFASGTSSRSTKLFHGGMRYLELAFKHLDRAQYSLVKQALHERGVLLKLAPHLTRALPIVIPIYSKWEAIYFWAGVKLYDKLSGKLSIGKSRWVSRKFLDDNFPEVSQTGIKGGVIFYDGQFDDARMNLSLVLTAISLGTAALNYVKLEGFEKKHGKITAALVKDRLSDKQWKITASHFVNATGPKADFLRRMDDPAAPQMIAASRGTHLVLKRGLVPENIGLLVPKTEDGRLLFLLPWQGRVLVGTTDVAADAFEEPRATLEEVEYLKHHLHKYLGIQIKNEDIKSSWAGLRPLLRAGISSSAHRVRDFKIEISSTGLISIMGGKWTSYRKMGEKTVDVISPLPSVTDRTVLIGGNNFDDAFVEKTKSISNLNEDILNYLLGAYGDRAGEVIAIANNEGMDGRLAAGFPYIAAEVAYACRHEYAVKVEDVIARRIPLEVLDQTAASEAKPKVAAIMEKEFCVME